MNRCKWLTLIALFISLPLFSIGGDLRAEDSMRGVELVILVQDNVSFSRNDPQGERFEAINILVELMDPNDIMGLLKFGGETEILREMSWKGTGNANREILKKLSAASSGNRSVDVEKALLAALKMFTTEENSSQLPRRALVFISDGLIKIGSTDQNEESRNRIFSEILPKYQKNGIPIYSVGLGSGHDHELIEVSGSHTGGFYFPVENPDELSTVAIDIFNDIKRLDIAPLEGMTFKINEDADEALIVAEGIENDEKCGILSPSRNFYRKGKNSAEIHWSSHRRFNIIRLHNPQAGRWNLHGRSTQNCTVFLDSPRKIKFMTPRKLMFQDENLILAAYLDQNGRMIQNQQILERMVFRAALENQEHDEIFSAELKSSEPGIYTGTLPLIGLTGKTRLNLYALSTDSSNKSYSLIHVSGESWLRLVSPPSQIPAGEMPGVEVQVLSDIDEEGRFEVMAQIELAGIGNWSGRLNRVKDTRIFKGHIDADLDPGNYTLSIMMRRFSNPVSEEMQVKNFPLHVTGMIERTETKNWTWLFVTGGIALAIGIAIGGILWYKRRKNIAELLKEDVPLNFFQQTDEPEKPEAAVLENLEDAGKISTANIFGDQAEAPKRVDPLEQLTKNIQAEDAEAPKEPKLAIESQGLTDVIDQVVQNVEGRVEKGPKPKKKVTGTYQEEEEVLMVKSGGNISLKVPAGQGIDKLAESLDSAEENRDNLNDAPPQTADDAAKSAVAGENAKSPTITEKSILSEALEVPQSDEPIMLSGASESESISMVSGGVEQASATGGTLPFSETDPPDMGIAVSAPRDVPIEKPMPKKARIPAPPQVSQNELDALLQQARQNIEKK